MIVLAAGFLLAVKPPADYRQETAPHEGSFFDNSTTDKRIRRCRRNHGCRPTMIPARIRRDRDRSHVPSPARIRRNRSIKGISATGRLSTITATPQPPQLAQLARCVTVISNFHETNSNREFSARDQFLTVISSLREKNQGRILVRESTEHAWAR